MVLATVLKMGSESLSIEGKRIVGRFKELSKFSHNNFLSGRDWESFKYEEERFSVWANSLNLHHGGHSSLDYRLRGSEKLTAYVGDLLKDLNYTLELCKRQYVLSVHYQRYRADYDSGIVCCPWESIGSRVSA